MPKARLTGPLPITHYHSVDKQWPRDTSGNTYDGTAASDVAANTYVAQHIDLSSVRRDFSMYGTTETSTAALYFATSHDGVKWYILPFRASLVEIVYGGETLYHFHMNYSNTQGRYIKVFVKSAAAKLDLRYTSTRY